jgi:hypothetical protein
MPKKEEKTVRACCTAKSCNRFFSVFGPANFSCSINPYELVSLWHLFGLGFQPTDRAVVVFGVPLAFLSFVEVSTVCLDTLAIFNAIKL